MASRPAPSGRPARTLLLVLGLAGAVLGACAPLPGRHADTSPSRQVFTVAFENLAERHIDAFAPGPAALSGLKALAALDEGLTVERPGRSVRLLLDGTEVASRPAPEDDNIYGWAEVAATLLEAARDASPAMAERKLEALHAAAFRGILTGRDAYSRYLSPEAARDGRALRDGFGGIGITIDVAEGETVIRDVQPGTPAARAGLRQGDRITTVDGRTIRGLPPHDIVVLLRGRVNEAVRLTLRRAGEPDEIRRELLRAHIVPQTVFERVRQRIAEIRLAGFNQGTAHDLRKALVRAAREAKGGLRGVLLDLRGNPGGLLDQAVAVADIFLDEGRIVSTRGRHPESNQIFDATPGRILPGTPMAVLIDGHSASAAEIVAVALRDLGRAVIVGTSSYGKGSVQTIVRLPNNGELIITWARLYAPSGQTLDGQGIVPAVCTHAPDKGPDAVLAALRDRSDPALTPAALRLHAHDTHYSAAGHGACPPGAGKDPREAEIARRLLADPALRRAAIARPPPALAER